ncbi:hypothetical protein DXN05_04970 [Deminuibacter soli]|uniref:Uncharacterized protein n=1 Tax=Deminuibacter soli TaxID=2291815 RepID=A0A3E1NQV8_9BACT|nr:hypothetical protein DXN05_04970 [Deminuibacter soli]
MVLLSLITSTGVKAQLKIGDNPTTITKSALLELQSTRQGFLLPRLADTLDINALVPPDGMMIYLDPAAGTGRGLYIRKSGVWQRITTDSSTATTSWNLKGNNLATTNAFLGTLDQRALRIVTNSLERMVIDSVTGDVSIANKLTVTKSITGADSITGQHVFALDTVKAPNLVSTDSLYLTNLQANSAFNEVLVINTATGAVSRRTLDSATFKGFIIGNFDTTGFVTGLEKRAGVGSAKDSLILHAATETLPGGVSVVSQRFAGTKSYRDSVMVSGTGTPNSNLQVAGSLSLNIRTTTSSETIHSDDYTVLANPAATITLTLPDPTGLKGRTYIIKKIGGGLDNAVNVQGNIEGLVNTTYVIYNDYSFIKIQTDGTSWYIIDKQ